VNEGGTLKHSFDTPIVDDHLREFEYALRVHSYLEGTKKFVVSRYGQNHKVTASDLFIFTSLCRVELTYMSILSLAAHGHINDAFALLRVLFESYYYAKYMCSNPEKLGEQWRDYEIIYRIRNLQRFIEGGATLPDADLQAAAELRQTKADVIDFFTKPKSLKETDMFRRHYFEDWTRMKLRDVARAVELEADYRGTYFLLCHYIHPSSKHWHELCHLDPVNNLLTFQPTPEVDPEMLKRLLFWNSCKLLDIAVLICKYCGLSVPDMHGSLSSELLAIFPV